MGIRTIKACEGDHTLTSIPENISQSCKVCKLVPTPVTYAASRWIHTKMGLCIAATYTGTKAS